jgi:hypothetical protein
VLSSPWFTAFTGRERLLHECRTVSDVSREDFLFSVVFFFFFFPLSFSVSYASRSLFFLLAQNLHRQPQGALLWARCSKIFYAATYADVRELGKFEDVDFAAEIAKRVDEKKKKKKETEAADATITTTTTTATKQQRQQQPPLIEIEQMLREEALVVWREYAALPDTEHY